MNRISIVKTAYNSEKFIGNAINSILDPIYKDFILAIIDDKSTDRTL